MLDRMKETAADRAVRDSVFTLTACELRQFFERGEQLSSEKKANAAEEKERFP